MESSSARGGSLARFERGEAAAMTVLETHDTLTGDRERFETFFARHSRPMVGLATSLVDQRWAAEEIVQEAFQQVWVRWSSLSEPSGYLRTTVVNSCNDELRRRRVRRDAAPALRAHPEAEAHYLADALSEVPAKRRRALVLRYYGGHTVSEVASAMDIPTGTAKSLIHRGLADLRGALD